MIRGRVVAIRPVEDDDAPHIHRWMNLPEVWRQMDYQRPVSLADVHEDIARSRAEGQPFTILVDDVPVGRIGLNRFRARDRICSMYMYIGDPASWGHGFGRDAIMALLGYAFDRWDLHQVELTALADNERAVRLYRSAGFVEEARLRERSFKEGAWVDWSVMSITREEFDAARAAWEARSASGEPTPASP